MKTRYLLSAAILGLSFLPIASVPANAGLAGMTQSAIAATENTDLIQVQGNRRGGARAGSGRNMNVNRNFNANRNVNRNINRNVNVNRGLYRGRYVYRGGSWARPRNYWWPVGGAIAAGAALGMVAASSAAWAGPAPGPGYCWYYTDPSRRQGFWDQCP